ncbi:hypothetical protein ACFLS7_04825 [Bacteroidota bacterium]
MKYYIFLFSAMFLLSIGSVSAQVQEDTQETPPPPKYAKPNLIKSGFYLKLGPVFPLGTFATDKIIIDKAPYTPDTTLFHAAKIGANLGLGYLIYIGPGIANNFLRFGIDATFIDAWFATAKPNLPVNSSKKETEFWYFFFGQKFGPVITINPVDRLMIDLSWKLNFNLSWHNSDWGYQIAGQEIMMNVRYRIIVFGLHYTMGKINYNDFDKARPVHNVDINTFRILLGFKF